MDPSTLIATNGASSDDEAIVAAVIREKFADALVPGCRIEFAPDEAEHSGAFVEDALNEADAADSSIDLADAMLTLVATGGREQMS